MNGKHWGERPGVHDRPGKGGGGQPTISTTWRGDHYLFSINNFYEVTLLKRLKQRHKEIILPQSQINQLTLSPPPFPSSVFFVSSVLVYSFFPSSYWRYLYGAHVRDAHEKYYKVQFFNWNFHRLCT